MGVRFVFQRLAARFSGPWRNVGWVALAEMYVIFIFWVVLSRGLFEYVGADFLALRASGQIAQSVGFAEVYDLSAQQQWQRPVYDAYAVGPGRMPYATVPLPYLPPFIALVQPLSLLEPVAGFGLWTLFNAAVFVLYLRRFANKVGIHRLTRLTATMCLALPFVTTLLFGQVNVWLLVFLGEFVLSAHGGGKFRAGLWLACLLLKPQTLIIFIPGLLLARQFTVLAGFALGALSLLAASVSLAGVAGLTDLVRLLVQYSGGIATNFPESMMNWRALALRLAPILPSSVAWGLGALGMVGTMAVALWLWVSRGATSPPRIGMLMLGTYAATGAISWHSHIHMALPTVVPLVYLVAAGRLPYSAITLWTVLPAVTFLAVVFPLGEGAAHDLAGAVYLLINLWLLGVAARAMSRPLPTEPAASPPPLDG